MISSSAYRRLKAAVDRKQGMKSDLGLVLRVYFENFEATKKANPALGDQAIEDMLTTATILESMIQQGRREFEDDARKRLFSNRIVFGLKDLGWAIVSNIVASILFTVLMLIVLVSAQQTVAQFVVDIKNRSAELEQTDPNPSRDAPTVADENSRLVPK